MLLTENITWLRSTNPYGHTSVMIQAQQVIYLDPVDLLSIAELPKADIILVTHDHPDHFSPQTIAALATESTKIVSIDPIASTFEEQHTYKLSPGDKVNLDGFEVEGIPAHNPSHAESMGHLGFVFSIDGVRIYCSGDTGLNPEMEALADIDVAILNVRVPYALSGADVVAFAAAAKPQAIIPIHWMPDDDSYQDAREIEYIKNNIPDTTLLSILELN
jgi:L-ascorbate metabolism protein UlaG (beta-lactamase superfamily)